MSYNLSDADRGVIVHAISEAELSCQYALAEDLRAILTRASAATVAFDPDEPVVPAFDPDEEVKPAFDPAATVAEPSAFRDSVEAMVRMLEEGEWAEHVAATTGKGDPLAQRLETAITSLINEASHD